MTELFKGFQQEFISSITAINKRIQSISALGNHTSSAQNLDKKQLAFNDIKADLTECQKNIKLMQTDIASLSSQQKNEYSKKIRKYKNDFTNTRKNLHKAQQNYIFLKNKEKLLRNELQEGENFNSKFISQGQMISNATYKLQDGVKMMHQTLQISNNIEGDLNDHTGRLIQNRKKMGIVNKDLGKSTKLIKTMFARIRKNKFVLIAVLSLIFLVIIIIMGVQFAKKKGQ